MVIVLYCSVFHTTAMEKQKVLRSWDFVSQDRAGQHILSLIDTLSSSGKGNLAITIAMLVMDLGIVILEDNFNRQTR